MMQDRAMARHLLIVTLLRELWSDPPRLMAVLPYCRVPYCRSPTGRTTSTRTGTMPLSTIPRA